MMPVPVDILQSLEVILAFCVAIGVVVFVHEYGHYLAARCCGVIPKTFSLGFGPTLVDWTDRRGTTWKVSLFPLGGYVRFLAEEAAKPGHDQAGQAAERDRKEAEEAWMFPRGVSLAGRFMIVAAGPLANILFAVALFAAMTLWAGQIRLPITVAGTPALPTGSHDLMEGDEVLAINGVAIRSYGDLYVFEQAMDTGEPYRYRIRRNGIEESVVGPPPTPIRIEGVTLRSAAEAAGIRPGDVIVTMDDVPVRTFGELRETILASQGEELRLGVWREGDRMEIALRGRVQDIQTDSGEFVQQVMIGVTRGLGFDVVTEAPDLLTALRAGLYRTWAIIDGTYHGLTAMISRQISTCNMQGVIGIAQVSGAAASQGIDVFIALIGVLSVAIGVMNLLPIPVLDGGHLVLFLYEALTGRQPAPGFLRWTFSAGLALILALLAFTIYQDLIACV